MLTLTISEFQGCDSVSYHSAVDWSHGVTEIYFAYIEREDMSEVYEEPKHCLANSRLPPSLEEIYLAYMGREDKSDVD